MYLFIIKASKKQTLIITLDNCCLFKMITGNLKCMAKKQLEYRILIGLHSSVELLLLDSFHFVLIFPTKNLPPGEIGGVGGWWVPSPLNQFEGARLLPLDFNFYLI